MWKKPIFSEFSLLFSLSSRFCWIEKFPNFSRVLWLGRRHVDSWSFTSRRAQSFFLTDVGPGQIPESLCCCSEQTQWRSKPCSHYSGTVLPAIGHSVSLVAVVVGSHVLRDTYFNSLAHPYRKKMLEYPVFDLGLLKGCQHKCASVVLDSLNPFSRTDIIVLRLKGAENRGTSTCSEACFCDRGPLNALPCGIVASIVGVWPLIVSHLKTQEARPMVTVSWYSIIQRYFSLIGSVTDGSCSL